MLDFSNNQKKLPIDSLNKRYLFKVISKISTAPIVLIIQAILPRGLGAEQYGKFIFQTNFFQQLVSFFDSGTSLAFFTGLSKNLTDRSLIKFYGGYSVVSTVFVTLIISLVFLFNLGNIVFPSQEVGYIFLALFFSVITWWSEIVYKIIDAYGLTISGEKIFIYQKLISLFLLLLLYYYNLLTLFNFFIFNYIVLFILIFWWTRCLHINGIFLFKLPSISKSELRVKALFFWKYSSPLLIYSFFRMLVSLFDNWLLMKFSGPIQQAFFGLAFKLSALSFMFTGSMTQLITREFSIAHGNNDNQHLAFLFNKYIPILYVISSFISIFFITNSKVLTNLFGGSEFMNGSLPVAIMLLYPIHQTYGQLSGSLFYATGQTQLYKNIGISLLPISIIFTWIALLPFKHFGLELGASGLALKTVVLQFLAVNVQLYFNTKYLRISFIKLFLHQLYILFVFMATAFFSKFVIEYFINDEILSTIISGILYSVLIVFFIYNHPKSITLSKIEMNKLLRNLLNFKVKRL